MRLRALIAMIAALAMAGTVYAEIEGGDRGVVPIASTGDFEVTDVSVDVSAKTAEAARYGGWRIAQRKAWQQLSQRMGRGGGLVSDSTLDAIVSAIVVQSEQIGPTRYIARLGVTFDRDRAGALLGIATYTNRSQPMVVVPVQWSAGVGQVFEQRTDWQEAWARFRTGSSTIDYIRPAGTGPDGLLLDVGQTQRPGRGWWRNVLFQYGGGDVLIPTVRLYRQWPGGPVIAVFQARHGPDNILLTSFTLRVSAANGLSALLDAGVKRIDEAYQAALRAGLLRTDPGFSYIPPVAATEEVTTDESAATDAVLTGGIAITVQFDTPGVAAVTSTEGAMRAIPGVSSAATSSLALGGISMMTVTFSGAPEVFKSALIARGWQVFGSGTTIRIRRAPQLLPPDVSSDNAAAG